MNRTILAVAGVLSASSLLLVDSAVKGTVLLALAAVAALILRRDSAATRHLVWLLAIVALLVVPLLSAMLPQWRVLPAWASHSPGLAAVDVGPSGIVRPADVSVELQQPSARPEIERPISIVDQPAAPVSESQAAIATSKINSESTEWSWTWINALPLVWAIGFSVLILRLTAARWMLWNSERRATVVRRRVAPQLAFESRIDSATAQDPIVMAMAGICSQLGINRSVTLLIHPEKTIPVVWGILQCRLMLPAAARQWSDEQLRSVLLHELAHIKRRDTLVQLLTQVACALHWFNPLVWFAAWRLDVERERACDDLVLASGVRPSAYAGHLLDVVTGLSPTRWTQTCGLAMARKSSLEGRLTAVLGKNLNRRRVSVVLAGLALAVSVGIAVPIAMLRAAEEKWNPHQAAHIGTNDFSAYCVHGGKDASFVIAYHGNFGSATESVTNPKTRTWTDSGTMTAKKPGIALSFHRTHTAPGKLSITTAPAEGRDLSKPAPPPHNFGQREYDLTKGRVFLLSDSGDVRQLDIATPDVTDQESAKKLAALIAAIPPPDREDVPLTPNHTGKLAPETIAKLKWGEPVNGLRMALAYPPALGDALLGKKPHFELVVQNVSEKEIHFLANDDAPNPRELNFRADNRTVLVIADTDTAKAEWHLQPGHCGVLRMFTKEERDVDEKTVSAGIEGDLSKIDRNHAVAEMEIAKAPAGAWTGKLITGKTRGSADKAAAPAPMHKDARSLYEVWQRYARSNGDIPGALVGELAAAVKTFIRYNPTWETVPKLDELLPRLDATHDWKPADAIALLDEVAGIQHTLLEPAPWKGTRDTIRQGSALPKKYADVPWGEEQPSGLRAAWVLEPSAAEHRIGTALKARLLVQNRGQVPVMLQVPTWHQGWVKASDAKGAEVEVSGIDWTTLALLNTVRLGPGASIEINTPGAGIGPRAGMGPWAGPRVGSNVLAKPGDELTLTYSLVPLDGSEVGVSEDDPHVSGPGWWLAHIKARLNRELPLPADAAERTRLLDRAVRELFATAPTAEETEAFITDKTPEALDALAKRLVARVDVVSFSGKLPTVPVKFRVLDADANADKQPRVVLGPGEYPLPSASARRGDATLKIVGRPVGDRRTNDAQLIFEATEFTGVLPPDSHKLEIPDGWGTWAIVCRPTDGFLFLLHKGSVRKIDYSKPRNVTDTPVNDLPAEFRDEVKRQLEIHEISSEQQAEIFEKPAAPATTPAPKTSATEHGKKAGAEVRPPVDDELVFITRDASLPAKLDVGDRVTVAIRQEAHYGAGIVASIRYTAADGAVSGHDVDMASQGFGRRAIWAAAWVRGTKTLWHVDGELDGKRLRLFRTDFADPRRIVTAYDANYEGEPLDSLGIPADVRAKFEQHFGVLNSKVVDKSGGLPDVAGEFVAAARAVKADGSLPEIPVTPQPPAQRWKVRFVDAATGQPVSRVLMTLTRSKTDGSQKSFVTRVVWDERTLDPELDADEFGFLTISDEALAAAEEGGRFFGNVPADVSAVEKHTNPNAPFIVKVKTREKTAAVDPGAAPQLPKLPDEAYTRPAVHSQKFREEDAKRPGGELMGAVLEPSKPADRDREPLVLGVRTASDAQWRIGGTAKVGLVVRNRTGGIGRNPPGRDVKFSYTGRLDNGLSVVAVDEAGKEHGATIAQFDSLLGFQQMLLPVAHVVTIKEFTLRFDAEKRDVSEPHVAAFHLPPGKYKLRCKWNDARPEVAHEGEWTGELVNEELEFTLAAAAEPATGEPNSGASAPQATATEKPKTTATESQPKTTAKEPFTAWGEEVGGLQAGLGFKVGEKRVYRHGETVTLVVRVRNVGNKNVKFQYYPTFLSENSPTVLDETGKRVSLRGNVLRLVHHDVPKQVNLAVGKEIELYERELRLAKGNEEADELKTRDIFPTGKFLIQHEQVIGNSAQASDKLDPTLEKLATGKLEFEVREPFTAWGEEVGGLQAGLGFKAGGKRAFSHGEKVTLVVRVRNVGKDEARFDYISEHFIENPPTVLDEKAMAVPLARGLVDTGVQVAREANLAPGKEIELAELTLEFSSRNAAGAGFPKSLTIYGTGKFQVAFEKVLGTGFVKLDPALGKLATGKLELEVTSPEKLPPEKETPTGPSNTAAEPAKPNPNYVTVVGRLLDDETGQPIEKAGWEWGMADPRKPDQISWGHSRSMGGSHPDGKFEMLLNIGANGHHYPLRVYSAGYETTVVVDELAKPYPQKIERNVRLKRGRSITGVLRDHTGNPVANGWVFFIPKGHQTNIVESVPGTDAHQLPANARDGAVSEVRTNENGTFALSTGVAGTLAASTDLVDLWPFPLPVDGYAELKMPAPSYLVIDLTYWYLDELAQKEKRVISPNSEDPNQCWIQVDQSGSSEPLWKNLGYRRQMLVFAKDPRAKLSKGVIVGHVVEWEMEKPIPDVGHNKNLSTKVRVALPPGNYRVQRLRTGPFAPVDEQNVELKSGEDTILSWARGDGSSVRGKANWPANMMFVRQPGEAPRKLDWTVPSTATVWIAPVGADGKDGKPIDAAKIQADGSFFVPTNLDPGKYKATARVSLPESDDSRRFRGYRGPDCIANAEFTVPDPARGPFGSPPVELEIKMEVAENVRFLRANAPADPPQAVQPPAGKAEELFTAWGKEVGGLQAGLGFKAGAKRAYRHGETVKVVLRVRNVGKEAVGFKHIWAFFVENPPTITDADGKLVRLPGPAAEGEHEPHSTDVAPGKEVELYEWKFDLRPKGESSKKKWSTIHGVGKFSLHLEQVVGPTLFNPNHPNPVLSKLATGKLELEIQPVALVQQETPKPKPGTMLKPATEQKLKWGEPVNGLRMALAWPPTLGEPGLGDTPEFYLVVQNVSEMGVRLTANDAAPNPRMLNLFDATIVSRTVDEVPIPGDWLLQPHEAAFVRLFHAEQKSDDGRTISVLKENVVSTLGQYSYTAEMSIGKAPAGAWTGKLVTGATRGSADVLATGKPIELRSAPPMSWGLPKDGLRGALRIIGELRTGKEAKAELWVRNSSAETVKFSWTHHPDVGLAIVPTNGSGPGREAHMTRGKTEFQLHFLALPAGQAVKLKEFTIRLGRPPTDGPIGVVSLELTPGDWTLQAKWTDTLHIIEAAMEWRGALNTAEIELKVTSEGATVVEAPKQIPESLKSAVPATPLSPAVLAPTREGPKTEKSKDGAAPTSATSTPPLNRQSSKLLPATERKLKWGEPVNGLRAALVMQPVPDEPDAEDKNDIFLVVQNVTKGEVWLHASDAAPNPRRLIWRDKGVLETITEVAKPIPADFRLQPGEVAFFRMTRPPGKRNPGGRSTGSLIEESIRKDPTFSLEGSMEISTAPDGAWSGKLTTRGLNVEVVAPDAPASKPRIHGKVLKPDGSPATDVQVRVDDGIERWKFRGEGILDLPKGVTTAADGTFSIDVAKHSVATNYEAFASSDDFAPLNVKVPESGDVGVMQFAKGSRVTGRVIGLDGEGLAKVGIWCKRLDWHGRGPAPTRITSTGADGTFSIPPIATGRHILQILTRDLGAKELTVAFADHIIETTDDAPVAVEIRPLPTVDLTLDVRVLRGKPEFRDFELRVSGTLPGHKAGEPASYWTRNETTKLTEGKHTIAVPAGLQNVTLRADRIYMRKDDEPVFLWRREGERKRISTNTLELGLMDQPQTISLAVHDAPTKAGVKPVNPGKKPTTDSTGQEDDVPNDSAPPNQPQAVQDGEQSIKTIPVTSKELSGIWYGARDRTGVVIRFIGRESRVKGTRGVVSGNWIVHVPDGSIGAALDFTDDPKAGVVTLTADMWDDKKKQSFTSSLGSIERGEDDTLYLTIHDNPREPMYLSTKRIPLIYIDDQVEIRRSDVEKMQSLMRSLKSR